MIAVIAGLLIAWGSEAQTESTARQLHQNGNTLSAIECSCRLSQYACGCGYIVFA